MSQTVRQAVAWATETLAASGDSARLEAEILLGHVLAFSRVQLYLERDLALSADQVNAFTTLIRRRADGEPVAYIVGEKEFYGLSFQVNPHVLIPRPETEILVEQAIVLAPSGACVLEIGVGSGAPLCALAVNRPDLTGFGVDISPPAVAVARLNARRHGVAQRLHLYVGDGLTAVRALFPLIVMNPPYIAAREAALLTADVRAYEPAAALFGGNDGLDIIRKVLSMVANNLTPGGHLIMEAGYDQRPAIDALVPTDRRLTVRQWIPDLAGIPRVVVVEKRHG